MTASALYECIPNFSEGRRPEVLAAIQRAALYPGVRCLGLDSDPDHHRSVLTLVGGAEALLEAVFRTMAVAVEMIDLTQHHGVHPRIGAVDVVPFVPLRQATMEQTIELAHTLGDRVARDLSLPVIYYEEAALSSDRRNLAAVRRGQFEGLSARLASYPPDVGPSAPHPTAGVVAVGARRPLIAFNVYLETKDMTIARAIARRVRGSSGGLIGVKALAMDTVRQGRVQVSMNLVNYRGWPLPEALEMIRCEAERHHVVVSGTELVGFMPFDAVEDVVRHYLQLEGFSRSRILEMALVESGEDDWHA